MGYASISQISPENKNAEEGETLPLAEDLAKEAEKSESTRLVSLSSPLQWFRMLSEEIHWSSVMGVMVVYGISQGVGGGIFRVAFDYYWKDVQKVQPSEAQVYHGITSIPWIVKPLWGLLTDVLPIAGYRRRPYFILAATFAPAGAYTASYCYWAIFCGDCDESCLFNMFFVADYAWVFSLKELFFIDLTFLFLKKGLLGVISMLILSLHKNLHVMFALLALTAGSAGVAIADVTIDACVAQNSITHPSLAADMQSLCGLSSSIGGLIGYLMSGLLIHLIGSQGVLGLLSIPSALVVLVGVVLKESYTPGFAYREIYHNFIDANKKMVKTLKCPSVWRPCIYMYVSLALSVTINEGLFYWYTDAEAGPGFSEESVGFIFSIGAVGSLLGVLLYQNVLKDYSFRVLLFWTQLLYGFSGMLDLVLVLRLNLKLGIPDYFFVVIDESVSQMISRIKWMPLLVLSSKLCPPGIEGTFFALLMSIDNVGLLTSSWGGGLLLHLLEVTRKRFDNLWAAILIRNVMRVLPLALLFLMPKSDQNSAILQSDALGAGGTVVQPHDKDSVELVALVERACDS